MNKIKKCKLLLFLCSIFFLLTTHVNAACTSSYTRQDYTMTLKGGSLYASSSAPLGSEIFSQKFTVSTIDTIYVNCSPADSGFTFDFFTNPLVQSAGFDRVYETNIPGIGIKFYNDTFSLVAPSGPAGNLTPKPQWNMAPSYQQITVSLIKTKSTTGRGVIQGVNLPVAQFSFITIPMWRLALNGNITINGATCDVSVPATTVNMGNYHTSAFADSGAATQWKDVSIMLNNCDQFNGRSVPGSVPSYDGNTNTYKNDTITNNVLSLTVTPNDGIFDASQGIFNIATSGAGNVPAATGIGIQLSSNQSDASKINLNSPLKMSLPSDGRTAITVPLYARYIKTGSSVTAGKANGKITYTIDYQ